MTRLYAELARRNKNGRAKAGTRTIADAVSLMKTGEIRGGAKRDKMRKENGGS